MFNVGVGFRVEIEVDAFNHHFVPLCLTVVRAYDTLLPYRLHCPSLTITSLPFSSFSLLIIPLLITRTSTSLHPRNPFPRFPRNNAIFAVQTFVHIHSNTFTFPEPEYRDITFYNATNRHNTHTPPHLPSSSQKRHTTIAALPHPKNSFPQPLPSSKPTLHSRATHPPLYRPSPAPLSAEKNQPVSSSSLSTMRPPGQYFTTPACVTETRLQLDHVP